MVDRQARTVNHSVFKARDRGVIFDVGHGQGSFDWEVAEICASCGFYPDTISTDLHSGNVDGAAKDLPWVMSKFLHLGQKSLCRLSYIHFSLQECLYRTLLRL